MTKETMTEFRLSVKDHVCDYCSVDEYLERYPSKQIFGDKSQMVKQGSFAQVVILCGGKISRTVIAPTVAEVMAVFKETSPNEYGEVPEFNPETFQKIADDNKASSALTCWYFRDTEKGNAYMEGHLEWLADELEPDDYVGEYVDANAFLAAVREKRILTELHCYPRTPVGFYNYYGLNLQSVIDESLKP